MSWGSTPKNHFVNLCDSCAHAWIREDNQGRRMIKCEKERSRQVILARGVTKCTAYRQKNSPSEWEMEKIAWTVSTDKSGMKIGFKPPDPNKFD